MEDILHWHPAILEAAVFGTPDNIWGQIEKAVICLKEGTRLTEAERSRKNTGRVLSVASNRAL